LGKRRIRARERARERGRPDADLNCLKPGEDGEMTLSAANLGR
jgi:hypothetical protein